MTDLFKNSIRWKLALTFVFCASLASLSGITGIFFLNQIQGNMARTTAEVGANIDKQVDLTTQLLPLRSSAFSILSARSSDDLGKISSFLADPAKDVSFGADLHNAVEKLLTIKNNQLASLERLDELTRTTQTKLDEVIKQAVTIVDDVEFDSELKIIDSISAIQENIGKSVSPDSIQHHMDEISTSTTNAVSMVKAALNVRSLSNELKSMVNEVIFSSQVENVDYTKIQIKTLLGNTESELILLPQNERTQQIALLLRELGSIIDDTVTAKKEAIFARDALESTTNQFWQDMNTIESTILSEARQMKASANSSLETSSENVRKWQTFELLLVIISLALAITAGMYISVLIIRPLKKTVAMIENIAVGEGDLTARLDVQSKDEIGELASWFNLFIEKLQHMIRDISSDAGLLSMASTSLSKLSAHMVSSSKQVASQASEAATATEEMSANINSIATATEEMSVNVQNVSSTAEEMSQNVESVARSIEETSQELSGVANAAREGSGIANKAREEADSAKNTIEDLGHAAKDIGDVTALIKRIAEQTNLLALNATIEAASAGDAGKGFAVVASEIKELARQSAEAAKSIADRIKGVQGNTDKAVQVINDVSDIINKINQSSSRILKSVEHQQNTATEISGNVVQAKTGTNNIASSISEVASGSNDMAKAAANAAESVKGVTSNIQSVSDAALESNAGSKQVDEAAQELQQIALKIQKMVDRFKT